MAESRLPLLTSWPFHESEDTRDRCPVISPICTRSHFRGASGEFGGGGVWRGGGYGWRGVCRGGVWRGGGTEEEGEGGGRGAVTEGGGGTCLQHPTSHSCTCALCVPTAKGDCASGHWGSGAHRGLGFTELSNCDLERVGVQDPQGIGFRRSGICA